MKDYLFQSQPTQLSYSAELRSMERHVGNER